MQDPTNDRPEPNGRPRTALVLSGGGARGAYEAGVLSHIFEHVLPCLGPGAGFDIVSGTSVGAIHAAFTAATTHLPGPERARRLEETWKDMEIGQVMRMDMRDLMRIPLRLLGWGRPRRVGGELVGGLVDISPLEKLVQKRVPWEHLRASLSGPRESVVCVSCTEVRSGRVTIFMDGPLSDTAPWRYDPNASAIQAEITARHVRASAAIPFLFPAVKIDERYYVDGGLRMNTPLSPALRLRAQRILVIALKHTQPGEIDHPPYPEDVITQPAFLLGKVLNALNVDQLEYELQRIEVINALLARGAEVYGPDFRERINVAVRGERGVGFRPVESVTVRPSEDIGRVAARAHRDSGGARNLGILPELVARAASSGVPSDEADLLSYLYFDHHFTEQLIEMGRADGQENQDQLCELLSI